MKASYDDIRMASGCARATITRALGDLEQAGLIQARRRNKSEGGGYSYTLQSPSETQRAWTVAESLRGLRLVYFVRRGDAVKIGTTNSIRTRFKELCREFTEPLALAGVTQGSYELERQLHEDLVDWRIEGEWFRFEPEVARRMREVCR